MFLCFMVSHRKMQSCCYSYMTSRYFCDVKVHESLICVAIYLPSLTSKAYLWFISIQNRMLLNDSNFGIRIYALLLT